MSGFDYLCTCGARHQYREVTVREKLCRVVDLPNNVNKYWRVVLVQTPCGAEAALTHSGRWTNGWRDRGAWKLQSRLGVAEGGYRSKTHGEYNHTDCWGNTVSYEEWTTLPALEDLPKADQRRANQSALAAQSYLVALAQAQLLDTATTAATAVAEKKPKPPALNGVDPLIELGRRTDTLVVKLSTSEFTVEMAAERARLLAELASYRSRLEQVESTLDIATALIAR